MLNIFCLWCSEGKFPPFPAEQEVVPKPSQAALRVLAATDPVWGLPGNPAHRWSTHHPHSFCLLHLHIHLTAPLPHLQSAPVFGSCTWSWTRFPSCWMCPKSSTMRSCLSFSATPMKQSTGSATWRLSSVGWVRLWATAALLQTSSASPWWEWVKKECPQTLFTPTWTLNLVFLLQASPLFILNIRDLSWWGSNPQSSSNEVGTFQSRCLLSNTKGYFLSYWKDWHF